MLSHIVLLLQPIAEEEILGLTIDMMPKHWIHNTAFHMLIKVWKEHKDRNEFERIWILEVLLGVIISLVLHALLKMGSYRTALWGV